MAIKEPYCDYEDYINGPCSRILSETNFHPWATKATFLIDNLTYGRASVHAEALRSELAYACGQIAEVLYQNHSAKLVAAGGLAGASNDGYSETYSTSREVTKTISKICYAILEEALGSDPYGLLYAGVI